MLLHRSQTPQPGFGSNIITKIRPPFQNPGYAPGMITKDVFFVQELLSQCIYNETN